MIKGIVYSVAYPSLLQASLHWNSPIVYPWSSHQCHRITEVVMSLPPWSVCRFLHHKHHLNHPPFILVWNSRLCLNYWFKSYLTSRSFCVICDKDVWAFLLVVFVKALFSVLYFSSCIPNPCLISLSITCAVGGAIRLWNVDHEKNWQWQGPVISHAITTLYPESKMVWQDQQCRNKGDNRANRSTFSRRRSTSLTFWPHLPQVYPKIHLFHKHYIYPLMPLLV